MVKKKAVKKDIEKAIAEAFKEAYGPHIGLFPINESHELLLTRISEYVYNNYAKHITADKLKKIRKLEKESK